MRIVPRHTARAEELKYYFTGKPCPRGHIDYRFTSVGTCKSCTRENAMSKYNHKTDRRRQYDDLRSFIKAASHVHGAYDYSEFSYDGAHTKSTIICPNHGPFEQNPTSHMQGKGCPACASTLTGLRSRSSTLKFVEKATQLYGDKYDYSEVEYTKAHSHVRIICKDHGPFEQTPTNHLTGKDACTRCNNMKSAGEQEVLKFLSVFTTTDPRNRTLIKPKELDIYLPERKLAIEYCGMFWHSHGDTASERANKRNHATKHNACQALGVRLITLYESEWQERKTQVRRLLRAAIGKLRGRVLARKCQLGEVSPQQAREFFSKYHIQGGTGNGEHYGLFWKGKLVACMRFTFGGNDRGAQAKSRVWTLSRYATRVNVVGGASRLFTAFLREHNPSEVKSFSDNRLFSGGTYTQLGFTLEEEVGPDYQVWSQKLGLRPKPHYQRRNLQARITEHGVTEQYDHETDQRTEAEMTYLMGARRIFDCGKKRWVWTNPATPDIKPTFRGTTGVPDAPATTCRQVYLTRM